MAAIQIRRSRRSFLLVVFDEDNGRFAIEGPMSDDQPWVAEVLRAQRSGRRVTCWAVDSKQDDIETAATEWERMTGRERWPKGSILLPEAAHAEA